MLPYTEAGEGEAVLLIHAGIADRSMWDEHLGWLARAGFRAIAVDLPDFIEGAQQLAQTLPDAGYATIAGAGHLAPLETPEAFERLLREFLDGAGG